MTRFLALDADPRGLFVAAGTVARGKVTIERVVALADDPPPLTPGTAAALGAKLKELLKAAKLKPAPVLLCVGRDRLILKEVKHPPTAPAQEPAVVRFQAVRDLTESPDDVVMDYVPLSSPAPDAERRALVVFARKEVLIAARMLCEAAGLKLVGLTPRPFAVAADRPAGDTSPVAIITISDAGGEFTVARGREVPFTRSLAAQATASEATLVAELKRNLTIYDGQFPNAPLSAIRVAEAEGFRGWADRLATALPIPVTSFDPIADAPGANLIPDGLHGQFAGPLGLLALKSHADILPINFAIPRMPRAETGKGRGRLIAAGIIAVLAVAVLATFGFLALDQAGERLDELTARKTALDAELAQNELDAKRLAAADEFTGREVVWLDFLYDLSDEVQDVAKLTVTDVEGTAIAPVKVTTRIGQPATVAAKDAKAGPVANVRVVLRTSDPYLSQKLSDAFKNDAYFTEVSRTVGGAGETNGKGQQYVLTGKALHREPNKYTRHLKVAPPVLTPAATAPAAPAAPDVEFQGFGGGFGP